MSDPRVLAERYELGPRLGAGGMATVHRGRDRVLERDVAIKILHRRFARDARSLERFRREARAAAALNHPNVVAVYDTGEDGRELFIVMEFVEGPTLAEILAQEGRLAPRRAAAIAAQICRGLAAAHARGLVHRDVKPANVILAGDRAKVADFGIARAVTADTLTETASVLGTAAYLSPEQARGERADHRADLYAVGCVLYEMLAGAPPFQGSSPVAVATRHVHEEPPGLAKTVPAGLARVTMRALAKAPGDRHADAEAMADALERLPADGDTDRLEALPPLPLRRGVKRVAAAGLGALALLLVGWFATRAGDDPLPAPRRGAIATAPSPSPSVAPSPSPSLSPSPPPSPDPPPVLAPEEAFGAFEAALAEELERGELDGKLADDLHRRGEEALEKHLDGKPDDAAKKLEDLHEKLEKGLEKGEVSAAAAERIHGAADALGTSLRAAPAGDDGEEEDDD